MIDVFVFLISIIVMMVGIQSEQAWIATGAIALIALTIRNTAIVVLSVIAAILTWYLHTINADGLTIYIIAAVILIAAGVGSKQQPVGAEEYYLPRYAAGGGY